MFSCRVLEKFLQRETNCLPSRPLPLTAHWTEWNVFPTKWFYFFLHGGKVAMETEIPPHPLLLPSSHFSLLVFNVKAKLTGGLPHIFKYIYICVCVWSAAARYGWFIYRPILHSYSISSGAPGFPMHSCAPLPPPLPPPRPRHPLFICLILSYSSFPSFPRSLWSPRSAVCWSIWLANCYCTAFRSSSSDTTNNKSD